MSDYTEHLISMAGGDGDPLDAIQRRADKLAGYALSPAERDRSDLLAIVRTQQATIDRVLTLANTRGRCGWSISSDELRRVLRGES